MKYKPNVSVIHKHSMSPQIYKFEKMERVRWHRHVCMEIKDMTKVNYGCALTTLKHLDLSYNKIQTLPKAINRFKNLTHLNITHNPVVYISSQGISALTNLVEISCDWCTYLQSGDIDMRPTVNRTSQFSIRKFMDIFSRQSEYNSGLNSARKMMSGSNDLIHFTLFITKAYGLEDAKELDEMRNFWSINNQPIRGVLQLAAELNHDYIVEQLIRSTIDVNMVDKDTMTAFDIAVKEDFKGVKRILLKRNDLIPCQYNCDLTSHPLRS